MTASTAALTLRADNPDSLTCTLDDRHWRIRGLEEELSSARLRVNLLVSAASWCTWTHWTSTWPGSGRRSSSRPRPNSTATKR